MVEAPTGLNDDIVLLIRVFEETKSFCSDMYFLGGHSNRQNAGHTGHIRRIAISELLTHFFIF